MSSATAATTNPVATEGASVAPVAASSNTPAIKFGTLCGRDGCRRKVELHTLDTASGPFNHVHPSLTLEAHNYADTITRAQRAQINLLIEDRLVVPFFQDAEARRDLLNNFQINLMDESAQYLAAGASAQELETMTLDKQAVATVLTRMAVAAFSPMLAGMMGKDPKSIRNALEVAAVRYVLPRTEGVMNAADAVTPNYVACLVEEYFSS